MFIALSLCLVAVMVIKWSVCSYLLWCLFWKWEETVVVVDGGGGGGDKEIRKMAGGEKVKWICYTKRRSYLAFYFIA